MGRGLRSGFRVWDGLLSYMRCWLALDDMGHCVRWGVGLDGLLG